MFTWLERPTPSVVARYGGAKVLLACIARYGRHAAAACVRCWKPQGRDILTKSRQSNLLNVAMATLSALEQLRSAEEMAMRGKNINSAPILAALAKTEVAVTKKKEKRATCA
jgi:ribosomal protein S5